MATRNPLADLDVLQSRGVQPIVEALDRLVVAKLGRDNRVMLQALDGLGRVLRQTGSLSELLGRRRLLLEAKDIANGTRSLERRFGLDLTCGRESLWRADFVLSLYADLPRNAVPPVPSLNFAEAVESILERQPELAPGWRATQEAWTERRAFALARSADVILSDRLRLTAGRLLAEGRTLSEAVRVIRGEARRHDPEDAGTFTEGYAATVYRTVSASAFTQGRIKQAQDPAVQAVTPGWRYTATRDNDVRPNHWRANGLIAWHDDPVWAGLTPPLGYNCRCVLELATRAELRQAGRLTDTGRVRAAVPQGAGPDEGFVGLQR